MTRRLIAVWSGEVWWPPRLCPAGGRVATGEGCTSPGAGASNCNAPPADPNKFASHSQWCERRGGVCEAVRAVATSLHESLTVGGLSEDRGEGFVGETGGQNSRRCHGRRSPSRFQSWRGAVGPDSLLFIFFIGHGTFDGREAKFNLVGPDLDAGDYNTLTGELRPGAS